MASVIGTVKDSAGVLLGGATTQASGTSAMVQVSSINPGVGFTVRTMDGASPLRNLTVHYLVYKTQ